MTVNDIEHIEGGIYLDVGIFKMFFQPAVDIAVAAGASQRSHLETRRRRSTVPIVRALGGSWLSAAVAGTLRRHGQAAALAALGISRTQPTPSP